MAIIGWILLAAGTHAAPRAVAIESVSVSRPFFNPTQGQKIRISFAVGSVGELTIVILDRDGFPVRRLVLEQAVQAGNVLYDWDGKDDSGQVVPDEAYSLKIDLASQGGAATYFPASSPASAVEAGLGYYDRRTAVLSYRLPVAARVHIQAGLARADEKSGERSGPVLKTLVNREPRPAGSDIETWNGLDETGAYYVPDLPGFVMAIAATSLPENSIITVGNNRQPFIEWAHDRPGKSLLGDTAPDHRHHNGLSVFDDLSPSLAVHPSNARQSGKGNGWRVDGPLLRGSLSLQGPSKRHFAEQPGALLIFVDDREILVEKAPSDGMAFEVRVSELSPGEHIVAFDWVSDYGPVAVTSLLIDVPGPTPGSTSSVGGKRQ